MKFKTKIIVLAGFFCTFFTACDTFTDSDSPDNYEEGIKAVDGQWQLSAVSRNGIDITDAMDFSQFRLSLNEDGTYQIENYLPFIVTATQGQWEVDDPQYPFHLTFRGGSSGESMTASLRYPSIAGKRVIAISFSPGCYSNTYEYTFQRITSTK